MRGGFGKTFLESGGGAASSILGWLSGEARPGQLADLELNLGLSRAGRAARRDRGGGRIEGGDGWEGGGGEDGEGEEEEEEEEEEEFGVRKSRPWRTVGSSGGRYG